MIELLRGSDHLDHHYHVRNREPVIDTLMGYQTSNGIPAINQDCSADMLLVKTESNDFWEWTHEIRLRVRKWWSYVGVYVDILGTLGVLIALLVNATSFTHPETLDDSEQIHLDTDEAAVMKSDTASKLMFRRGLLVCGVGNMMHLFSMDEVTQSYIVFLLAILPWVCYFLIGCFFATSIIYGRVKLHQKDSPVVLLDKLPGVSIVKPLMGIDPLLEGNLESHFLLNYPKFEILCCVQDEHDPVIGLVKELQERYPKVDCRLFLGGRDGILNPMVNNMAPGYEAAKYDVVWVSTSRIKASTDILMDMVVKIQHPKCAIVHQMPYCTDRADGIASAVEKVYFGSSVARFYLTLNAWGFSCFTGMSYLIKKTLLDEGKGLAFYGKYLAEDYFIAKMLHEKGFRHQVAAVPAQQNVSVNTIAAYKDRMVRWFRLRLNMIPFTAGVLEPLGESIPIGCYMAWSVHHFFNINPYLYFLLHWVVWCILDYIQLRGVQHGPLPFNKCTYVVAWVIRELLFVFVYFEAIFNVRHITWGRRTFRLSNFGEKLEIVSDKPVLPI